MTDPESLLRASRRMTLRLAAAAIGIFAAYTGCVIFLKGMFATRIAAMPFGIWLAVLALVASYAIVVLYVRAARRLIDPVADPERQKR